jgi:N-acetylmuramoyl-L-alanine amidase
MPKIYLSPSTQESNPYVTGSGSEEYNMNLLADELEPYLYASGIQFVRNTPEMTAASSIAQANAIGGFDFYLALHSNAAGPGNEGNVRGVLVFYYPTSVRGQEAAEIFAARLREVYPLPDLVRTVPTTSLGEVRQPRFPANLIEIGYHDNYADALWIESDRDQIAQALARGLTEYFGVPFTDVCMNRTGTVVTEGGNLNLRAAPSTDSPVLTRMPNGSSVTVCGERNGWYSVNFDGISGYGSAQYMGV